eukprot:SAG22_NODE_2902_length_2115_cov_1.796627_1_plen_21_part_10
MGWVAYSSMHARTHRGVPAAA